MSRGTGRILTVNVSSNSTVMLEVVIQQWFRQQPTILSGWDMSTVHSAAAVWMCAVIIANCCYSLTSEIPHAGFICTFLMQVLLCALHSSPLLNLSIFAVSQMVLIILQRLRSHQSPLHVTILWSPSTNQETDSGFLNIMLLNNPFRKGTGLSLLSAGGDQDMLAAGLMMCIEWKRVYIFRY
jgi:hypothetical protein